MMEANLKWISNMQFTCENREIISKIDATKDFGGNDFGPTPKELLLNAMMGCSAMDVVSMLKKMRQNFSEFTMNIEAEKTTKHPIHFKTAVLNFKFKGAVDPDKLIKSVEGSLTKYCGVNYIISKTCVINYKVFLNEIMIKEGPVSFIEPESED